MSEKLHICPVGIFCNIAHRCKHSRPHKIGQLSNGTYCCKEGLCAPDGFQQVACIPIEVGDDQTNNDM